VDFTFFAAIVIGQSAPPLSGQSFALLDSFLELRFGRGNKAVLHDEVVDAIQGTVQSSFKARIFAWKARFDVRSSSR